MTEVARMTESVTIIGGGLAGSEAAYQAVKRGCGVTLIEMKPARFSPAHTMEGLAELVCSNSLKSESLENASGVLKEEMRICGSLIIKAAEASRVPAGNALAVDRKAFSDYVTRVLTDAGVEIARREVADIPEARPLVIATGPLTSGPLAGAIAKLISSSNLYFYDAVAPIVYRDSIGMDKAFMASRYGKGGDDYINCPLDEDEYRRFVEALLAAEMVQPREFEEMKCFEGCMPIEVMARRGPDTLMFGPMKPVGLVDPRTGKRPCAAVQLRRENIEGTLYNIVGFQTRMTFPEQRRVLGLIPGLERAEFARFGKLHRNSYIDSPRLLTPAQALRTDGALFFAGQITGVEGYCESSASGLLAGMNACRRAMGQAPVCPPPTTVMGALVRHISSERDTAFTPMNANFGLLPPLKGRDRRDRLARRAVDEMRAWMEGDFKSLETSA